MHHNRVAVTRAARPQKAGHQHAGVRVVRAVSQIGCSGTSEAGLSTVNNRANQSLGPRAPLPRTLFIEVGQHSTILGRAALLEGKSTHTFVCAGHDGSLAAL